MVCSSLPRGMGHSFPPAGFPSSPLFGLAGLLVRRADNRSRPCSGPSGVISRKRRGSGCPWPAAHHGVVGGGIGPTTLSDSRKYWTCSSAPASRAACSAVPPTWSGCRGCNGTLYRVRARPAGESIICVLSSPAEAPV